MPATFLFDQKPPKIYFVFTVVMGMLSYILRQIYYGIISRLRDPHSLLWCKFNKILWVHWEHFNTQIISYLSKCTINSEKMLKWNLVQLCHVGVLDFRNSKFKRVGFKTTTCLVYLRWRLSLFFIRIFYRFGNIFLHIIYNTT